MWYGFMLLRALRPLKTPLLRGLHKLPLFDWYMHHTERVFRTRCFAVGEYFQHPALDTPYLKVEMLDSSDPRAKGKSGVVLYTFFLWIDKHGKPLQVRQCMQPRCGNACSRMGEGVANWLSVKSIHLKEGAMNGMLLPACNPFVFSTHAW